MRNLNWSARSLSLLVDEFGANVLVTVHDHDPLTKAELAKRRAKVAAQQPAMAVPSLIARVPFAIIGDSELVGRPQRVLKGALHRAQIDPQSIAWLTVSQHTREQLEAADVGYVLLVGAEAKSLWRRDLRLNQAGGKVALWDSRWFVFPVVHPAALFRVDNLMTVREWEQLVVQFVEIVREQAGTSALEVKCVKCGAYLSMYDKDGVAWCGQHAPSGIAGSVRGGTKPVDNGQLELGELE